MALSVQVVRAGRSIYFSPLADIVGSLTRADREGRLRERIRYLCRAQLLFIDEIDYLSVGANAGKLFFQTGQRPLRARRHDPDQQSRPLRMGEVIGDPVIATALPVAQRASAVLAEAPPHRRGRRPKATDLAAA
ncbi:MAG: ATP-binding protein [Chloroflexi bacterium]|nr:ATP-binding protein [Chloroflexota bacterium]